MKAVCGRGGLCLALVVGPLAVRDDERRGTATATARPSSHPFFVVAKTAWPPPCRWRKQMQKAKGEKRREPIIPGEKQGDAASDYRCAFGGHRTYALCFGCTSLFPAPPPAQKFSPLLFFFQ